MEMSIYYIYTEDAFSTKLVKQILYVSKIYVGKSKQSEASSSHQTPRSIVEEVVVARQCTPARPLKPLTIWVSRDWNTLPIAQISPLPTITLDRSKMLYDVVDFLRTKKCRKRCINGCATNRKPSWREYASLWTAGPSASKRKETVEK
jgi:hypothetical protein